MPPDPDWVCIERFYGGEPSAFNELFKKHKTRVLNLAFRFVRNRQTAEDIAQEVFIKIYEKKFHFD